MIQTDSWQAQTIEDLENILLARDDVVALAVFGSAFESGAVDVWSDVDCLLVIEDHAYAKFYPATEWIRDLGEFFAVEQSENPFHGTTRICFADFRRVDLVITTEAKLREIKHWSRIPFWRGNRLLFSRSPQVSQLLHQTRPPQEPTIPSQVDFDEMTNRFWFKAMLAGYKIVRDDRLIALHLALDLVRDCCVLGMMLRDRKEGTNIHRDGGMGNLFVDASETTCSDYSATSLLNMIEQSTLQFEQLAKEWTEDYQERRDLLLPWLKNIRRSVDAG